MLPCMGRTDIMQESLFSASPYPLLAGIAYATLLLWACVADIRSRRIPNALVATLALMGFGYMFALSASPGEALVHCTVGLILGLALWLPFYALRWLGAGDVKLFAAAGVWLGPMRTIEGALIAALAGGVLAVLWMLRAYGGAGTAAVASLVIRSPTTIPRHPMDSKSQRAIPYGVALAIGAMTAAWFPDILTRMFHAAQ